MSTKEKQEGKGRAYISLSMTAHALRRKMKTAQKLPPLVKKIYLSGFKESGRKNGFTPFLKLMGTRV